MLLRHLVPFTWKQTLASGMIPQITAVFRYMRWRYGNHPGAYELYIHRIQNGKMFVNSPNALDSNYTEKCDTAAAAFRAKRQVLSTHRF